MAEEQLALLDLEGWEQISMSGAATARSQRRSSSASHGVSMMGFDPSQGMIAFASGHFGPYGGRQPREQGAGIGARVERFLAGVFCQLGHTE